MAQVIRANEYPVQFLAMPTIFLAGPTPRSADVVSWRIEALEIIERYSGFFKGAVFVPESPGWHDQEDPDKKYDDQVYWEWSALEAANAILFWVPRNLDTLPGFTTNVEFGMYWNSKKVVLGFPEGAPKTRYLERLASRGRVPILNHLEPALYVVMQLAKNRYAER